MGRFTIYCPVCRKSKTADSKHGFKLFALSHGVLCSADKFKQTEQMTLEDMTGLERPVKNGKEGGA